MNLHHILTREMNDMETIEEYAIELLKNGGGTDALEVALTPRSAGNQNNERLEFLGNTVLNMRLAEAVCRMEQHFPPATMSLMCNYLRSNPVLVIAGREGGLAASLARHGAKEGGKVTDKMVSTAFEAIVGALYEQEGYGAASLFIDRFLLTNELVVGSANGKGAITELKELVDRDRDLVVTHSTSERTEDGLTMFCHITTINGKAAKGEGRTKKGAEAKAAAKALAIAISEMSST
jgi:ribonuclease III